MSEQTFVIIKPDAIAQGLVGRIISRLEDIGLKIIKIEIRHKNEIWCREHYAHIYNSVLIGRDIYGRLRDFMTVHSTIGIILSGPNVIERVRRLIGATNALEAEPGTIRGDWGNASGPYNLIHASDSVLAAVQEIELYFNKETDQ